MQHVSEGGGGDKLHLWYGKSSDLRSSSPDWKRTGDLISSTSGMEGGEVFCRLTDWLGSRDPMTRTICT